MKGLLCAIGAGIGYVVLGRIGFIFASTPLGGSPVWPAAGIATAATLICGRAVVFAVGGATAILMWLVQAPAWITFAFALGNSLNALVAWRFRRKVWSEDVRVSSLTSLQLVRYVGFLCAVPAAISAAIGGLSLQFLGPHAGTFKSESYLGWWLGDTLGSFIVGLLILYLIESGGRTKVPKVTPELSSSVAEYLAVYLLMVLVVFLIFGDFVLPFELAIQLKYLVLPILVWAALRFPIAGTVVLNFWMMACVTVLLLYREQRMGRPMGLGATFDLLNIQGFLGVTCGTGITLACAMGERGQLLEKERASKLEAISAASARDEFLAIAAHELRTPLTPIGLHLQLIRAWLDEVPSLEAVAPARYRAGRRGVHLALEQLTRLTRLVDDLLDAARLTQGSLQLRREFIDVSQVLSSWLESHREQIRSAHSDCRTLIEPRLFVWVDKERIEQIFVNFLSNAQRYARGTRIEITLSGRGGGQVVLRFRDWGLGVPVQDESRIFEKYQRFHPATKHGGLGLGLYLCRQIAEGHGGSVHYRRPPPGEPGAIFELILPRAYPQEESKAAS